MRWVIGAMLLGALPADFFVCLMWFDRHGAPWWLIIGHLVILMVACGFIVFEEAEVVIVIKAKQ